MPYVQSVSLQTIFMTSILNMHACRDVAIQYQQSS